MKKLTLLIVAHLIALPSLASTQVIHQVENKTSLIPVMQERLLTCFTFNDKLKKEKRTHITYREGWSRVAVLNGHYLNITVVNSEKDLCAVVEKIKEDSRMRFGHAPALIDSTVVLENGELKETLTLKIQKDIGFHPTPDNPDGIDLSPDNTLLTFESTVTTKVNAQ